MTTNLKIRSNSEMSFEDENIDKPTWTLFFEGTLYRRYIRYLKHHDLSQMLNNGTTLTSSYGNVMQPPVLTNETSWRPPYTYPPPPDDEMPPPYPSSSSERSDKEFDYTKVQRRTKWLICFGITFIALAATIVALVIHFLYIETGIPLDESGHIHIPGNFTANQTLAILEDDKTTFLTEKDQNKSETFSKHPGSGSFWRNDPLTTTTTKRPKLVLISEIEPDTTDEWRPSERPPVEPVLILDVETTIGEFETSLTCIVQTADWDLVYLIGSSVTLNFTKSQNLKTSKHHSRLSFDYEFKIMDGSDMTEIKLTLRIKKVECGDQDDFVCGFVDNSTKIEKHAKLIVKRKPTSYIKMKQPIGYIEGQPIELQATWKGGYPSVLGNITWFYTNDDNNTSEMKPLLWGDITWRMKTRADSCKTYINSIVKFVPVLEMNGTMLHAVATYTSVDSGTERILIIPENYCDNEHGDVYKPNPYTCKKFVRCRPDRMDVYECPEKMCFSEKLSQCDLLQNSI